MKIYHGLDDFTPLPCAVVTSGTFDGVHVGHQKILARLNEIARKKKGESVVITFWPHPRLVLHPEDDSLKLLNTFEEKAELLKEHGIHHLVRIPFTKDFSQLSSMDFIQQVLVKTIGTCTLVIGHDHRFGKNREGSFEELKKNAHSYGFEIEEIPRQDVDHIGVSSTKIRQALEIGEISLANALLGRPYRLTGRVIPGDRLGRQLGFPTANIEVDTRFKLIPSDAIYAVKVLYDHQLYKGMMYIGNRPTLSGIKRNIEVNIFDFNKDIYGENLTLFFYKNIRNDIKFKDVEALRLQLVKDKEDALFILNDHG